MRDSYLYGSGDEEKIAEICRKMIETDSEAREKYEQFLEDADCEEDINWFFCWTNWLTIHMKRWLHCMIIAKSSRHGIKNMKAPSSRMTIFKNILWENK